MARKFSELRSQMPVDSQSRARSRTAELLSEMRLADLRRARRMTQDRLAEQMNVNQAWISKVERQSDMYLSTLRAYVKAIGGDLEIIARFGESVVHINQLVELDEGGLPPRTAQSTNVSQSISEVYGPAARPDGIEVWQSGVSNTTRPSTPTTNTPTSRAAA